MKTAIYPEKHVQVTPTITAPEVRISRTSPPFEIFAKALVRLDETGTPQWIATVLDHDYCVYGEVGGTAVMPEKIYADSLRVGDVLVALGGGVKYENAFKGGYGPAVYLDASLVDAQEIYRKNTGGA